MFERLRNPVLRFMRVPHDPDPPAGAPGTVQVFRAGQNFYKLRLVRWGFGQVGALIGIALSLTFLNQLERSVYETSATAKTAAAASTAPAAERAAEAASTPMVDASGTKSKAKAQTNSQRRGRSPINRLAERWPTWLFPLLTLLEWVGVLLYVVQIPFTYAMARLDYELRWYIVTDRSLRIRAGLASVQETTMSFANVQQVIVTQGPLQRLLGIADVRVQSAGGGGEHRAPGQEASLHTGIFHGVDNASQIRDLILERLRQFRETGLGDPDERRVAVATGAAFPPATAVADATRELLEEVRALRQALS